MTWPVPEHRSWVLLESRIAVDLARLLPWRASRRQILIQRLSLHPIPSYSTPCYNTNLAIIGNETTLSTVNKFLMHRVTTEVSYSNIKQNFTQNIIPGELLMCSDESCSKWDRRVGRWHELGGLA